MMRWRQRMGDEKLEALLQESLFVAVKLGAAKPAVGRHLAVRIRNERFQ